jgi:RNA polymerase sigma-70 factor (ECF subfamily)
MVNVGQETGLSELVRLIIVNDARAEEELVRRYKDGICIIITRIVQNHSAIEDISQETFRIALEKIKHGDVREPERLSGFICGVARNLALEHTRKVRRARVQDDAEQPEKIPDPTQDQFERLWLKERAEIVRRVIKELKVERDREILYRYYIDEDDKDSICADLGLTRGQFNRVVFRALNRYRDLYLKRVGDS